MEKKKTKRVRHLNKQERHSMQRACFMQSDINQRSCFDPALDLFHNFSASEALQAKEQKCSKRLLTIDRELDLTIPAKIKKPIQELDTCDAFISHDVIKSETKDEFNVTPHLKFEEENLCESIPKSSEKTFEEGKIEFNLQPSVFIKIDDSTKFIRLKCFDSIMSDGSNDATFFVGGPIQSSAFCVTPCNMKVNQYIAIAASNAMHDNYSYSFTKHLSGLIQFWNLGSLHKSKMLSQKPSMGLALYHDNGIATQMKWCPVNCYDKHPSTSRLPRLGLLAVSFSDSSIYIYSVPQPESMPKLKSVLPIYFTLPSMKLMSLSGEPCNVTKKSVATCFEWDLTGERIVAGFGNGSVCVWLLKVSISRLATKSAVQSPVIQPYLFFQASGASIASLSYAPFGNVRWLAVSSIDKTVRFFDLCDTTAPFCTVKQGLENSCLWADTFCGVYSSPSLNPEGLITLSVKECCTDSSDYQKGVSGFFDSSTHVAVSENKSIHVSADMSGTVSVHYIQNACKPYETSYLTNIIFETQVGSLDEEVRTSEAKLNLSGNRLSSDIKDAHARRGSSSVCSPKCAKPIVIETACCFERDATNWLPINDSKDFDGGKKVFSNESLKYEETVKHPELSEDLMRSLLMEKISKSSADIFSFGTCNNPNFCNSGAVKDPSGGVIIHSSASSNDSCDTIIYALESHLCDPIAECLGSTKKANEVSVNKMKENIAVKLKPENCSSSVANPEDSHNKASSKNWCESSLKNCNLNESKNLKKIDPCIHHQLFPLNGWHFTSRQSFSDSREDTKSDDALYQSMHTADSFVSKKSITKHSLNKSDTDSLCDGLHSKNLNDASSASSNFVICDNGDPQPTHTASNHSFSVSDYSVDTILYSDCDEKPASKSENGETSLCKVDREEPDSAKCSSCAFAKAHVDQSLRCNSENPSESVNESFDSSDQSGCVSWSDCLTSDFHLLHSEYLCGNSEENRKLKDETDPQELPYKALCASFGVIFRNNSNKSSNHSRAPKNDIYVKYNPLSVIKTMSWNPNDDCHSWLFVGGNSGIGRLFHVPDFAGGEEKPRTKRKKKRRNKRSWR